MGTFLEGGKFLFLAERIQILEGPFPKKARMVKMLYLSYCLCVVVENLKRCSPTKEGNIVLGRYTSCKKARFESPGRPIAFPPIFSFPTPFFVRPSSSDSFTGVTQKSLSLSSSRRPFLLLHNDYTIIRRERYKSGSFAICALSLHTSGARP